MLLVDTNVLIDVVEHEPEWIDWSLRQLRFQSRVHELAINPVIYAELSLTFQSPAALDARVDDMALVYREIPRDALFLAARAHLRYRQTGGVRRQVPADFFIGAHAAVLGCGILTRDSRRYRQYFPTVDLVTP